MLALSFMFSFFFLLAILSFFFFNASCLWCWLPRCAVFLSGSACFLARATVVVWHNLGQCISTTAVSLRSIDSAMVSPRRATLGGKSFNV